MFNDIYIATKKRIKRHRLNASYLFRRQKNTLLLKAGLKKVLLRNRPGKRIIAYHGIALSHSQRFNTRFISRHTFEQQLAYYSRNFNTVSLDDYFRLPQDPDRLTIAITFDDGYLNNLHYALPILEQYGVPASFFITGVMDTEENILWADLLDIVSFYYNNPIVIDGESFSKNYQNKYISDDTGILLKQKCLITPWRFKLLLIKELRKCITAHQLEGCRDYWQQMDIQDIQTLASSSLVTVGSHGYYHNNLGEREPWQASDEIKHSKRFLEQTLGKPIKAIAFPGGSYTPELLNFCCSIGFTKQLACDYLFKEDYNNSNIVNRITINPYINFTDQISSILTGNYC